MANPLISSFRRLFNTDASLDSNEWILLKVNLPDDIPELQNLFSLQVLIKRDWFDETKQTEWEDKKNKSNKPQFRLGEKNLQISSLPARLASYKILGKEFVLDQTKTSIPNLQLNGLFYNKKRVDLENTPWLLEATLASGSIRLLNSEIILPGAQHFLKQLWPSDDKEDENEKVTEEITGIYLSRQQFQLEIQQFMEKKNKPIDDPARRLPTDDPARRLKFVGYQQTSDNNTDIIWQLVSATGKDIVNKQEYASPEKRLRELVDEIKKYSIPNRFQIETYPVDSGIFYYVSFDPTQPKPGSKRELIKPGVIVSFLNDRGEWTRWIPQSLEIEESGELHLDDADAIQALLKGTPLPSPPKLEDPPDERVPEARLELKDKRDQFFVPTLLPSVALTGANPEIATGQQEWWQLAVTKPMDAKTSSDYDNQPATWLRYHIEPPALQPDTLRGGKRDRLPNVQGPFSVKTRINDNDEEWLVYLDIPAVPFYIAPPSRRLRCTLKTEDEGGQKVKVRQIRLFAPEIYIKSPQTLFYNLRLNDPQSTPLEQLLAEKEKHVPHSLEFQGPILPKREKLLEIEADGKNCKPNDSALSLVLSEEFKDISWNQLEGGLIRSGLQQFNIKEIDKGKRKITLSDNEHVKNFLNSLLVETSRKIEFWGSVDWESSLHIIRAEFQAASPGKTRQFHFYAGQGVVTAYLPASRALIDPVSPTRGNLQVRPTIKFPLFSYLNQEVIPDNISDENLTVTLSIPFSDPPDDFIAILNAFFIEFKSKQSPQSAVFGIKNVTVSAGGSGNLLTGLALKGFWPFAKEKGAFDIVIGPTRLAVPRDPNHGLIPLQFGKFEFEKLNDSDLAYLKYDVATIRGQEVSSVLAMHPWSEWGPHPDAWLKTGRIRLHHRNLVQEHAEFESSFEDRFPPTGPQSTTNPGQPSPTPLLPFEDFRRAVRDRYAEASGNIEPGLKKEDKSDETKNLRNWIWIPGVDIQDSSGQKLVPQLEFAESDDLPFPNVTLDFKGRGSQTPEKQVLQIRKPGESTDTNWLEYDVDCRNLSIEAQTKPHIVLHDPDQQDQWLTQRVVNSSAPLIFDRTAITALEYLPIDDQKFVVLAGHQHGELRLHVAVQSIETRQFSFEEPIRLETNWPNRFSPPTTSVTAAALTLLDGKVYALTGYQDGSYGLFKYDILSKTANNIGAFKENSVVTGVAIAAINNQVRFILSFSDGSKGKLLIQTYNPVTNSLSTASTKDVDSSPVLDIAFTCKGDKERLLTAHPGQGKQMQLWDAKDLNNSNFPKICDLGNLRDKFEVSSVDIDLYTFAKDGVFEDRLRLVGAGLKNEKGKSDEILHTPLVYILETALDGLNGQGHQLEAKAKVQAVRFCHIAGLVLGGTTNSEPNSNYFPYLCVGCQDGSIKLWDLVVGLREIRGVQVDDRHLLAATAAHIPLANRSSTSNPDSHRLLVAGTDRGEILLWDAYTAEEISPPKPLQPSHSLDNLGVIRPTSDPVTVKVNDQDWLVQSLKDPDRGKLYSISTLSFQIATTPSGDPQPTDIRFSCQELKVIAKDGTLVPADSQNERFDLGRYGFSSTITSADESLRPLNHWPRLAGIPIFPTRLVSLSIDKNRYPLAIVFEAILPNPDDLATGVQEDESQTNISSLVRQAIARQSAFEVHVNLVDWDISTPDQLVNTKPDQLAGRLSLQPAAGAQNGIDWSFAVNRQTQFAYPQRGFKGSLARLVGQVNLEEIEGFQRLTLTLPDKKSEALIFGRLWEIDRLPAKLVGESSFTREKSGFQQEYYRFHDLRQAGNVKSTETPRLEFTVNSEKKIDRVIRSQLLWLGQNSGSTTPIAVPDATQIESLWQQAAIGTLSSKTGEAPFEIDIFDRRSGLTVPVDGLLSSASDVDLLTVGLSTSNNAILNDSFWAFLVAADSNRNLKILRANKSPDRINSKPQDKDTLHFTELELGKLQLSSPPSLTKVRWVIRSPFAGKKIEVIAGNPAQLISLNHGKRTGDTIRLLKLKSGQDPDTVDCFTLPVDANKLELLSTTSSSSFIQVVGWEALNRILDLTGKYPSKPEESFIVNSPDHNLESGDWIQLINVTSGNQETQRSFFEVEPKDDDHFRLLNPPVNTFTIIADTWSALQKAIGIKFNSTIEIEFSAHGLNDGDRIHLLIVQGDKVSKTNMGLRVLKIDDNHFKIYKNFSGQLFDFRRAKWKYAAQTEEITVIKSGIPLLRLSNSSTLTNGNEIEIEWPNSNKIKAIAFRLEDDQFELWTPLIFKEIQTSGAWWTAVKKGSLERNEGTPAKILSETHKLESGKRVILVEGSGDILTQDQLFIKKVDDNSFEVLKGLELTSVSSLYAQDQQTTGYLAGIDDTGIVDSRLVQFKFKFVFNDGKLLPQFESQKQSIPIQKPTHFHTLRGSRRAIAITTIDKNFKIWDLDKFNSGSDTTPLFERSLPQNIYSVDLTETPFGEVFIVTVTASGMIQVWKLNDENPSTSQVVLERKLDKSELHWARFGWDDDSLILAVGQTSEDSKKILLLDLDLSQNLKEFHQFILPDDLNQFDLTNTPAGLELVAVTNKNNQSQLTLWSRDTLLRIDSRPERLPEFSLSVDFQSRLGNGEKLSAEITPARQLVLFSGKEEEIPALPTLVQGIFYCFVLEPTVYDASRGKEALMLWVEGDLGEGGSDVELWAMRIKDSKTSIEDIKFETTVGNSLISGLRNRLEATITGKRSYSYTCDDLFLESSSGSQRTSFLLTGESLHTGESLQGTKNHLYSGVMSVDLNPTITLLALSSDGKKLLTAASDRTVRVWDISTGQQIQKFAGHTASINAIAFSPDGSTFITATENDIRLRYVATGKDVHQNPDYQGVQAKLVSFSPKPNKLFITVLEDQIRIWDAETGRDTLKIINVNDAQILAISFSSDGKKILVGLDNNQARLYDLEDSESVIQFNGHTGKVNTVAFSPVDDKTILTGSDDKSAILWKTDGSKIKFEGHTQAISIVAFSPDATKVLTGSNDTLAKLWDVNSSELKTFGGFSSSVTFALFIDENQLLTGSIYNGVASLQNFDMELQDFDILETAWQIPISLKLFEDDGISKLIPQSSPAYARCIVTNNAQSESRPVDIRLRSAASETKTTDFSLRETIPSTIDIPGLVDITGHWAELYIIDFYARRIVNGYPTGTFKPDQSCLRADIAVVLKNAFKLTPPSPRERIKFRDDADFPKYAKEAIDAVVKKGWITGYDNDYWYPNEPITRALLICAVCNVSGLTLVSITESKGIIGLFVDENGTGNQLWNDWMRQRVATAIKHGLVIQYPTEDKLTRPHDPASRGLVTATIHLLMSKLCQNPSVEKIEVPYGAKVIGPDTPSSVPPKFPAPFISRSFLFKSEAISQISNFVAPQFSINNNNLQVNLLSVTEEDEAFPPLDLNLEPGASRSVPRMSNKVPQISHRSFYGPRLRYNLNLSAKNPSIVTPTSVTAGQWLLSPVTWPDTISKDSNDSPQTVLFSEDLWLSKLQTRKPKKLYQTDNLLVLYRPPSLDSDLGDGNRFLYSVLSTTEQIVESDNPTSIRQRHQQYQQQLSKTGAAGVALHRSVLENGEADFGFVNSPFFSNIPLLTEQGEVVTPFKPNRKSLSANIKQPVSLDFRLQVPAQILQLKQLLGNGYTAAPPTNDPLRLDPYVPLRTLRYHRPVSALNVGLNPKQNTPRLHLQEATAFRDMPLLGQPSPIGRRANSANDHLFLPRQLEIRYAPDKPGAVMHHILRSDVGQPGDRWTWKSEPAVDVILREPQQIKLGDRVTGEMRITNASLSSDGLLAKSCFSRLTFRWNEVLGKVPIDKKLAKPSDPWVEKRGNELVFLQPPLQGIFQFNDEVMEIVPSDAAIPGYQVISQINTKPESVQYRLPRLFAISQLDEKLPNSDAYRHHHLVPAYSDGLLISGEVEAIAAATNDQTLIATLNNDKGLTHGDVIEIIGNNNNDANNDDWRIIKVNKNTPNDHTWYLLEDTVGNGWANSIPPDTATVMKLSGTVSIGIKSASNTKPIIITTSSDHGLADGDSVKITGVPDNSAANNSLNNPSWRVWVIDPTKFSILGPSKGAESLLKSGVWQKVQSRTAPFVQLSPETPHKSKLTLPDSGSPQIEINEAITYIRVTKTEKPEMSRIIGTVWRVITDSAKIKTIHPLSYGNGRYSNPPETRASVVKAVSGALSFDILDTSNTAPIKLKTINPNNFNDGDTVTVIGVQGNTAANGKWRVVKIDATTVELFFADVPGGQVADTKQEGDIYWYALHHFDSFFEPVISSGSVAKITPGSSDKPIKLTVKDELSARELSTLDSIYIEGANSSPEADSEWQIIAVPKDKNSWFLVENSSGIDIPIKDKGRVTKPGSPPVEIDIVRNTIPISIQTKKEHELETGESVTIDDADQANGQWYVAKLDENNFVILKASIGVNSPINEGEWSRFRVRDYMTWKVRDDFSDSLTAQARPIWQITWASLWENLTDQGLDTNQRVFDQYPIAKQIKFLSPSQLTPKLAAVWVQTVETGQPKSFLQHRTLLFGDSAPAAKAQPTIEGVNFVMLIKDNTETVDFGMKRNVPANQNSNLYLIKFLTTGTVIYDSSIVPKQSS